MQGHGQGQRVKAWFGSCLHSHLIYPNSLVPIKMCLDCETCGLLNHCKMIEEVTRKCVRIVRHTD